MTSDMQPARREIDAWASTIELLLVSEMPRNVFLDARAARQFRALVADCLLAMVQEGEKKGGKANVRQAQATRA